MKKISTESLFVNYLVSSFFCLFDCLISSCVTWSKAETEDEGEDAEHAEIRHPGAGLLQERESKKKKGSNRNLFYIFCLLCKSKVKTM